MQIYAMTACSGKVIKATDYFFRVFYTLLEYFDWFLSPYFTYSPYMKFKKLNKVNVVAEAHASLSLPLP